MDLDEIKRGLRAEIKKRENEQYFTFQCNVRQMCKDVLAKLEEQEAEIAELKAQKAQAEDDCAYWKTMAQKNAADNAVMAKQRADAIKRECLHKYKRCLDKAELCQWKAGIFIYKKEKNEFYYRWHKRWQKLAEKFNEAK